MDEVSDLCRRTELPEVNLQGPHFGADVLVYENMMSGYGTVGATDKI
jgi:hypothetical protein